MCIHLTDYQNVPSVLSILEQKSLSYKCSHEFGELFKYIQDYWIENPVWDTKNWSSFKQPIRTNRDEEGWHLKVNRRDEEEAPPFYSLIELLYKEAELIPIQATLLCQKKLISSPQTNFLNYQKKNFWLLRRVWRK